MTDAGVIWGLTGLYCAGKNRAGAFLEAQGCYVIDVDKLGHQGLEARKEEVVKLFGSEILDDRGMINRRALGDRVFKSPRELRALEAIVHPWAIEECRRLAEAHGDRPVVINAALLFPSGLYRLCSRVIWVKAPLLTRVRRARRRDHLPYHEIFKRFWAQRALRPQPWREDVDIESMGNPDTPGVLESRLRNFLKREL